MAKIATLITPLEINMIAYNNPIILPVRTGSLWRNCATYFVAVSPIPNPAKTPNIPTVLSFRGAWDEDALKLLREHRIGEGRWVRLLGRNSNEREVALAFRDLHQEWRQAQGGTR